MGCLKVTWHTLPAFVFLLAITGSVKSKNINNVNNERGPLILTPLIESGQANKARELSKVDPALFADVNSHAAYITVNKTYKWHTFFWFFPVENKPLDSTPWLIWLQGGPGASSMYGLFNEIGPLQCNNTTASKMPVTWASNYSLLFIDNPIGAGFSFSEDEHHYVTTDEESGVCLLAFIEQFLQVFPELQKAPLFIAGESYAGKYIPSFGHQIHQNKNTSVTIPLKGLIIADGFTDPPSLLHYSELGAQFGFWDFDKAKYLAEIEDRARKLYDEGREGEYESIWRTVSMFCLLHITNSYNILKDDGRNFYTPSVDFLNRAEVQTALHVGNRTYDNINFMVNFQFQSVFYRSAKPWLEELLEHYGVLAYNGQLDFIVGYALSEHTYRSLKWSGAEAYLKAERKDIKTKNPGKTLDPIGYVKGAGNFMEVMIRAAGHMAPADQPLASKQVIDMFIEKFI